MSTDIISYTDSAISDLVKEFFQKFKDESNSYKYVNNIDECIDNDSIIFNTYDLFKSDFSRADDIHELLLNSPKRFLKASARAAREIFQQRHPGIEKRIFVHVDDVTRKPKINEVLGNKLIGKMVTVNGMITSISPKFNVPNEITFVCPDEHVSKISQSEDEDLKTPMVCNNSSCKHREFEMKTESSDFEEYRLIVIKSNEDFSLSEDDLPILLSNNLVDIIDVGENVQITGFIKTKSVDLRNGKSSIVFKNKIICSWVKKIDDVDYKISDEDIKIFEKIVHDEDFYKKMVNSIAPSVLGMSNVKESILLQQIGSPDRIQKDGTKIRGNFHIGVWGHGGVAKTKVGEWLDINFPKIKMIHSDGASAKGLLLGLEDNAHGSGKTLHAGAFVYCKNGGTVILDEFVQTNPDVKKELMTTLESGIASIAKSGHQAKVVANASLYATGNAFEGEWDENANLKTNLNLTVPQLQRFDYHWIVLDKFDESFDTKIANTILNGAEYVNEENPYDAIFLYKYIKFVQRINPILVPNGIVNQHLLDMYLKLRKNMDARKAGISPRHLNTMIRSSIAIARIYQRKEVIVEDVDQALTLMMNMLEQQNISISESDTYLSHQFNRAMQIIHDGSIEGYSMDELFSKLRSVGTEDEIAQTMVELGESTSQADNKKWRAVIQKLKNSPRINIISRKPLVMSFKKELGDMSSFL